MSSRGSPWMVEAARGEERTGREGLVSMSYSRSRDSGSGADPGLWAVWSWRACRLMIATGQSTI